ncbi:MAG: cell division protein SepF [Firmicutes bacterium]|jgi:cell division inhibitor SepF|nr:cell division protein SepF [Bacillota bacterium]
MAGFMEKFWRFIGLGDEEYEDGTLSTSSDLTRDLDRSNPHEEGVTVVHSNRVDLERDAKNEQGSWVNQQQSQAPSNVQSKPNPVRTKNDNVVPIPSKGNVYMNQQETNRLVVYAPNHFEEVQVLVDHMKARRPVIVSLEGLDGDLARSMLDFVCGAAYALEGSMQKISGNIFLVAPSDVDVSSNLKEALLARDALVRNREEG